VDGWDRRGGGDFISLWLLLFDSLFRPFVPFLVNGALKPERRRDERRFWALLRGQGGGLR
jgi:hypothetical protein